MAVINGTSGSDTLNGTAGSDTIDGLGGNDTIYGGDGVDYLHGGDGDDIIYAGTSDNHIFPEQIWDGAGNDTVYGEQDQDVIFGSPGDDYYDGGTGFTVQSWESDQVNYADALAAIVVDMRLSSGQVRSSGAGDAANIGVDTLVNIEEVHGSAFGDTMTGGASFHRFYGGAGNDTMTAGDGGAQLVGGDGNDVLTGGTNHDTLEAGAGADMVIGGDGNDTLTDAGGDDTLDGGAGTDLVSYDLASTGVTVSLAISGPQDTGEGLDTLTNIERLAGSEFDDTLTGDSGDNSIFGNGGFDTISGGAGDDVLWGGGAEADDVFLFSAGDGMDTIADHWPGEVVRISGYASAQSITQVGGDVVVVLSATDQITFRNTQVNYVEAALVFTTIDGTSGDDVLNGTGFDDTINGLQGADTVQGGDGDDTIFGGADADSLSGDTGADLLGGGDGNDVLDGGIGDDRLYGEAGHDTLDGGAGADLLNGGGGDDSYWIDSADTVIEYSGAGSDTVYSAIGYTLGWSLETLRLLGSAAIDATGNSLDNLLVGNSGANVLDGAAGADTLWGGSGNDIYWIDNAGDRVAENAGQGDDLVYSAVSFTLGANIETLRLLGSASIDGFGNDLANLVVGTAGSNVLGGGSGDDRLWGGSGDDRLYGEDGNDILDGGAGADLLNGGTGDDSLYVDDAGDQVVEYSSGGSDTVYSAISYTLGSNLENLRLLGSAAIDATGNAASNLLVGNAGANTLDGGAGNDILWSSGGNDTLDGGSGIDRFAGGTGSDTFVFADGDFGGATIATADRIQDFAQGEGDMIDLAGVDANSALAGDQGFAFIGSAGFSGSAGELRFEQVSGNTFVSGDIDGDGLADFMIRLDGTHTLTSGDFII